jgi:hypothetical protein
MVVPNEPDLVRLRRRAWSIISRTESNGEKQASRSAREDSKKQRGIDNIRWKSGRSFTSERTTCR